MIQITREDSALSGTLDQTSIDELDPTRVKPTHAAFTGTIDGNAITLSFPGGFGIVTNLAGTLTKSAMTLQVPRDDGSLATAVLNPASVETYNERAAEIRAVAEANAAAGAAAIADAKADAARQKAQQQIAAAADTVSGDTAALRAELAKAPSFSAFDTHLAAAAKHLENAKAHAQKAATSSDQYDACSYAYDSQSAAYDAQSAAYDVESDVVRVNARVTAVDDAVSRLDRSLSAYTQASAGLPSYTPPSVPDRSEIQALESQATKQTDAWKAKSQGYRSQVAALEKKAFDIAEQAITQYC